MRSCDEMDILIQLKLDDLLDPSQERLLEEHLRECRSCRERYEQLRVLKDALGSMEEPAPAGLHGSIMRYVEKNGAGETPAAPAAPKSRSRAMRRFLTAAAAVAACCAIVNNQFCIHGFLKHQVPIFEEKLAEHPVSFSLSGSIDRKVKKHNKPHIPNPFSGTHTTSNDSISSTDNLRLSALKQSATYSDITDPTRYVPPRYAIPWLSISTKISLVSFVKSPSKLSNTTRSTRGLNGSMKSQLKLN